MCRFISLYRKINVSIAIGLHKKDNIIVHKFRGKEDLISKGIVLFFAIQKTEN